jgi:integrase
MGRAGSGVEARTSSIRVQFVLDGETVRERVMVNGKALPPTPANMKYATRLVADIKKAIALGTFSYADFFPDSPRAKDKGDNPTTFGPLADLWLESQGRLADASQDQYGTAVRFWKKLLGADRPLEQLTHQFLVAKIGGYPWSSAKTHNNYLIALRGILGLEYRGAKALANPLAGISNMKVVRKLPDPLTIAEREQILADMAERYDERVYAYFLWQFFTGMRPEEAIALRWSDLDANRGMVRVQRVRTFKGAERDGSKTHTERDVDLVPQALQALAIMKKYTFMQKVEREGDDDTAADIFMNPVTGRPWHDERSQRDTYWRPAMKRLGIRWRRPYNTRHTFATVALMASVPPAYISSQLGNSVKMLLEVYARWIPANDQGSARAMLAAAMGGAEKQKAVANDGFSSQIHPNIPTADSNSLNLKKIVGRHDWTRTKKPGNSGQ